MAGDQQSAAGFLPALILATYTITGFDASAHVSEETHEAAHNVPKGIVNAVLWSAIFGYIMVSAFVLSISDMPEAIKSGMGFLQMIMLPIPPCFGEFWWSGFLLSIICADWRP